MLGRLLADSMALAREKEHTTVLAGLFAALLPICLAGCGAPLPELNRLARGGTIHSTAPVLAHVQLQIAAPPPRVWSLLVNAACWPVWNRSITKVVARTPLQSGTRFDWSTGDITIHSQVQRFQPDRSLSWTGVAYTVKAVHVWVLEPLPNGRTRVSEQESIEGPLASSVISSQDLTKADNEWLIALQHAAEAPPQPALSGTSACPSTISP